MIPIFFLRLVAVCSNFCHWSSGQKADRALFWHMGFQPTPTHLSFSSPVNMLGKKWAVQEACSHNSNQTRSVLQWLALLPAQLLTPSIINHVPERIRFLCQSPHWPPPDQGGQHCTGTPSWHSVEHWTAPSFICSYTHYIVLSSPQKSINLYIWMVLVIL